ncbi:hypothetical protein PS1_016858 [Malus domestica]
MTSRFLLLSLDRLVSEAKVVAIPVERRLAQEKPLPSAYDEDAWLGCPSMGCFLHKQTKNQMENYGDLDRT